MNGLNLSIDVVFSQSLAARSSRFRTYHAFGFDDLSQEQRDLIDKLRSPNRHP
jgi:hypothetical protein